MKHTYQVELVFATVNKTWHRPDGLVPEYVMTAPVWVGFDEAEHYAKMLVNAIPAIESFKIHQRDANVMPETHMWIEGDPVQVWTYNSYKPIE